MTTTYVCRHCGEPVVRGVKAGGEAGHLIDNGTLVGSAHCRPNDPDSPTCEAVEAGSDIGILWAAHHVGWVARVRVHGGEIVALDVPTILADFGGDWLEDFADMADTRRPLL